MKQLQKTSTGQSRMLQADNPIHEADTHRKVTQTTRRRREDNSTILDKCTQQADTHGLIT